jgi:hypothetical protein
MLIFIGRLINKTLQLLLVTLPLQLVGAVILLPLCIFYDVGRLPRMFRYFDSADPYIGRDITVITQINDGRFWQQYSPLQIWWGKYCWLAWRNPINYFEYTVSGVKVPQEGIVTVLDQPDIQADKQFGEIGTSKGNRGGLFRAEADIGNTRIYEYYIVHPYTLPYLGIKCFRFRLGFKIDHPASNKPGSHIQAVFTINPFASYEGKL